MLAKRRSRTGGMEGGRGGIDEQGFKLPPRGKGNWSKSQRFSLLRAAYDGLPPPPQLKLIVSCCMLSLGGSNSGPLNIPHSQPWKNLFDFDIECYSRADLASLDRSCILPARLSIPFEDWRWLATSL